MTKWEPKEKRTEDIINAAVEVFLEKGYEGTSMETIAQKAGISKGGLYHHFHSKEEILYYANEKLNEPVYRFMDVATSHPNAVAGLKGYIRDYISYWTRHPRELTFFFLSMTKALACPEMWGVYEKYCDEMHAFFVGLFEKGIQNGQVKDHNVHANALTLMSALDGVLVYLIMHKAWNPEMVIHDFEEQFITPYVKI